MVYITSDQPKLEALDLGELDLAFLRTANVIADARASGQYSEAFFLQSAGEVILINNGVGTHTPVTADKRFRQAVNLAIDSSVISERAFGGELLESKAFIDERSTYYSGVAGTSADPDAARALVDELKAEGWDGSIRFNCRDTNANLPVAIVASLEAVGMTVEATVTDQNSSIGAVIQKDFDMACWGWNISDSALYRQIGFNFRSDSPSNRIGYSNPDMDAAIDEMFAAPDREARTNAIAKMSEIFNEDVPSVIYAAVEEGYAISDRVAGIVPTQQTVLLLGDAYLVS
jgi:peptide/nickel transport system substrate-binding protein